MYKLPDLPYDYGELEPHLSGRVLEIHHGKHHALYVENANKALQRIGECIEEDDLQAIPGLERALAFNLSGHVLHSIYWHNMAPGAGGEPDGDLGAAVDDSFGSFQNFRTLMTEAAQTTMGSGWAALVWEPIAKRLIVSQIYDHQSNHAQGSFPIFVIDAWEHAYYLQYQNKKDAYCRAVWEVANWSDVQQRFAVARRLNAHLPGAVG